jgi:predicted RNA-binding protein
MKVILSEKFLKELELSQKNRDKYIGHGGYQYAFSSSDPDKIIKFGRNHKADKEEEVINNKKIITDYVKRKYNYDELYQFEEMQKHPNLFVKILKISKNYVVTEKLNSLKSKEEYIKILNILRNNFDISFKDLLFEYKSVDGNVKKMDEYYLNAHNWLLKNLDQSLLKAYKKFTKLVEEIEKLRLFEIDISATNFGYDKNGNLKMLDV